MDVLEPQLPPPIKEAPVQIPPPQGETTPLEPAMVLTAAARGELSPPPLTSEQRQDIFHHDWENTSRLLRLSLMKQADPTLQEELKLANLSTPEAAITYLREHSSHPETIAEIQRLLEPQGFDPQERRSDFLSFAERHGAITGRKFVQTMNEGMQQRLESLAPMLQELRSINPAAAQQLGRTVEIFNTITSSGIVNPNDINQLFNQLPTFFDINAQGLAKKIAGRDLTAAYRALEEVRPLIQNYSRALSGEPDVRLLEASDELQKNMGTITQTLLDAQSALESAQGSAAKIKTFAFLGAAAFALLIMNGMQGMQ